MTQASIRRLAWLRLLLAGLLSGTAPALSALAATAPERPNFVVILVDDAALMDFGAYGGEARTPHIDDLAARGARFTRYHTSPLCAPSRAMLLTGLDNHLTGVATIPEVLPPEQRGQPGYTLQLEPGVRTIASRLKDHGYRTLMTGKWHLGHGPGALPHAHGFDRSFVLDASGADNWEAKPYMPYYSRADWFEDGQPAELPEDFYSSAFLVDRMIDYLDEGADADQPFFAYLAFQAIHIPVQAPRAFTEPYTETYADGWDALRARRFERAQALGLVPPEAPLADRPQGLRRWETLAPEEQALQAQSMAVNAGMLEAMDHHIGRLIEHLQATGRFDNTIFLVTSDNGPEPSDPLTTRSMRAWLALNGYSRDPATLGERGSYVFIGPEWAWAAATPSDLFKFYTTQGGLRVPFIVAGPGVPAGTQVDAVSFVTDVTPTLLDYAGITAEPDAFTGRTLRPVLAGQQSAVYGPEDAVGIEVSGNAALFKGDWKLVRNLAPWGSGQWQLFDLSNDPGETRDLATDEPDRFADLQSEYAAFAARVGVIEMPPGYDMTRQIGRNSIARQIAGNGPALLLGAVAFAAFLGIVAFAWRRRSRRA
jgi:arylsulfatase A-like enzyme